MPYLLCFVVVYYYLIEEPSFPEVTVGEGPQGPVLRVLFRLTECPDRRDVRRLAWRPGRGCWILRWLVPRIAGGRGVQVTSQDSPRWPEPLGRRRTPSLPYTTFLCGAGTRSLHSSNPPLPYMTHLRSGGATHYNT